MSRADSLAATDKQVQDFVVNGEVTNDEIDAGVAPPGKWLGLAKVMRLFESLKSYSGYQRFAGGVVEQWGTVTLGAVGAFNPQTLAGVTWYTHYYTVNLPTPYKELHFEVLATLAGRSTGNQAAEIIAIVKTNKITAGAVESLTSFTVSVTSPQTGWAPTIHYKSTGK